MEPNSHEQEYDFALVLTGLAELPPDAEDALFEAGCDDATISVRSGQVRLLFSRAGASFEQAVSSAIADAKRAKVGADVVLDVHDSLGRSDG